MSSLTWRIITALHDIVDSISPYSSALLAVSLTLALIALIVDGQCERSLVASAWRNVNCSEGRDVIATVLSSQETQTRTSEAPDDLREAKEKEKAFCSDVSCVRCNKPCAVLEKALERIRAVEEEGERRVWGAEARDPWIELKQSVEMAVDKLAIKKSGRIYEYPGIPKMAFWSPSEFPSLVEDVRTLEANLDVITSEYRNAFAFTQWNWRQNEAPKGRWDIYYLINQGEIIKENVKQCPKTFQLVTQLRNFLGIGNVFANVAFSTLEPGTEVAAHYGPTNIRLRCHLPLQLPDYCHMSVDGVFRCWVLGQCLLFDDFLLHSVHNESEWSSNLSELYRLWNRDGWLKTLIKEDNLRVVLLLDFWQPQIDDRRRSLLSRIFQRISDASCSH